MNRSCKIAALAFAAFATPALAQSGWYGGISIGQSKTDSSVVSNRESTVVNATVVGSDFDSTDTGYKVFGGFQILPHLAVELNYADLGKSRLVTHILAGESPLAGAVALDRKVSGFGADLLVTAPIGPRASIYGRVGAVRSRLEADATLTGNIVFTNGDPSDRSRTTTVNETVKRVGVGSEWKFGNGMAMRLDWERWYDVGKPFEIGGSGNTGEANVDFYSIGVVYRF